MDPRPVGKLSDQLDVFGIAVNPDELEKMSLFEQFPSDIMIGILEYVPEAVRNLRLVNGKLHFFNRSHSDFLILFLCISFLPFRLLFLFKLRH